MCGLVGVFATGKTSIFSSAENAFFDLLIADSVRGAHSTGIIRTSISGATTSLKKAGDPFRLFSDDSFNEFMNLSPQKQYAQNKILVGHNRYATKGKITSNNAHPFVHKHISLCHNGTLRGADKIINLDQFEVDSEAICHAFSTIGVEATIGSIQGAWSLVWVDSKLKTLNFLRNTERPMFYAKEKNFSQYFFASEPLMLQWVASRHKINLEEIKATDINSWYSIGFEDEKFTIVPDLKRRLSKSERRKLKNNWSSHYGSYYDDDDEYDSALDAGGKSYPHSRNCCCQTCLTKKEVPTWEATDFPVEVTQNPKPQLTLVGKEEKKTSTPEATNNDRKIQEDLKEGIIRDVASKKAWRKQDIVGKYKTGDFVDLCVVFAGTSKELDGKFNQEFQLLPDDHNAMPRENFKTTVKDPDLAKLLIEKGECNACIKWILEEVDPQSKVGKGVYTIWVDQVTVRFLNSPILLLPEHVTCQ